jgi:lipopolysaccharide/colanic/teichoic acid biosynthesis glycosyltransferase
MKSEALINRHQTFSLRPSQEAGQDGSALVPLWKRVLDLSLIAFAAPAWLPIMLGLGAAIKILSPGPVLFRQERIGLGGRRFVCFKFRTMHAGTNTAAHEKHLAELIQSGRPMTKLDGHDPRLIPLARLLRSTGLDELPQLFNVIRGEMSIVGPRPCTPKEYEAYSISQRARTGMLPGLTGLWQVNGKNHTTFNEMIELDIRYINALSFWRDLAIILRTPVTLVVQVREMFPGRTVDGPSKTVGFPDSIRKQIACCGVSAAATDRNSADPATGAGV